jgi:hypothetical protein
VTLTHPVQVSQCRKGPWAAMLRWSPTMGSACSSCQQWNCSLRNAVAYPACGWPGFRAHLWQRQVVLRLVAALCHIVCVLGVVQLGRHLARHLQGVIVNAACETGDVHSRGLLQQGSTGLTARERQQLARANRQNRTCKQSMSTAVPARPQPALLPCAEAYEAHLAPVVDLFAPAWRQHDGHALRRLVPLHRLRQQAGPVGAVAVGSASLAKEVLGGAVRCAWSGARMAQRAVGTLGTARSS